ncbi:ammonium/methylammonium permease [Synechocystis sp. PCC 6803]|uniref:Putative ammonium transporter sll0537 n=1 Tax=Synechocystis sp. (strain ATCC 27184 / PCC 6803 / Kazusa) TaxID=1111708 RepID=Y537_SYNY3|nr:MULTISPECIES: ammonium transporter [unclassified Synechocystis]P54148.1 RecName: Full=Putative ammonium transporter sll0537 [Synechocystis sp. PCC 6803 substr. Kazusa]AGF53155.1 ammonium/methylammonium permease [Synechocystis sp. PCC 6803]ALJ69033.1 ammonium transporter [Synechocystis sp. PCC 6803]AVP90897.1 ammonium transporter [Synechocystis sp. IPPAS B-1465]MBD2618012.1 ammonium transporter [Synechocystis sp. FACHB-898]MBD2639235.1 ammonium transporter [Synechocystis sp. FACHB-908]
MTSIDTLWLLLCAGLVFFMQAGFMCLESGLTRSKNSINVAIKNFADFGISVALFWSFGFSIMFGLSQGGWWGTGYSFVDVGGEPTLAVFFLFQAMFCGTATTIISGAAAERLKFSAYLLVAGLASGLIYPLFGDWAWNGLATVAGIETTGGWLENLGFRDFAGSTVVHSVGAWIGLATILVVGPRQGRFPKTGKTLKIQGSNMPFSVLGTLILWFGWLGFNGGSTFGLTPEVPGIMVNTVLAGVGGMLMAGLISLLQDKMIQVEPLMNGSLAGLVAITASANVVMTPIAMVIGATGSAIAYLVGKKMLHWGVDDAVDAVAVHGGAGVWGTLCVGLFGQLPLVDTGLNRWQQCGVQLLGIGVCTLWAFGLAWVFLTLLNRVFALRISPEDEEIGLNVSEHQATTETYELFQVMDRQAKTHDLSLRVPVNPFTEVGHIAGRYNQVMDAFEARHHRSVEDLAQIYYVTAAIAAAIENNSFKADQLGLEEVTNRADELGALARTIQQMAEMLQQRDQELIAVKQQLVLQQQKQHHGNGESVDLSP